MKSSSPSPASSSGKSLKRSQSGSLLRAPSRGSLERLIFESSHCNGPTVSPHAEHSLLFRLIQFVVFVFRLITPLSYLFLASQWYRPTDPNTFPGGAVFYWAFLCWMAAEAAFFPYYYYLFTQLNNRNEELQHFASDHETRKRLAEQCFQALLASAQGLPDPPEIYIRRVIEGWFLDESISKICFGNAAAWAGWAFFNKALEEMTLEETKQNNELVQYIEEMAKWKFPPGFTPDLPSLRLNLDPIFATQRPFLFYLCIFLVNSTTHLIMRVMGFRRLGGKLSISGQNIYYRPGDKRAGSGGGEEVVGKGAGAEGGGALPIVFVHGIGIGFAHYLALIYTFPREVDVFLVEWPYVAMQMSTQGPRIDQSVRNVVDTLDTFGHAQACFVAHSLGSSLVSWMLHDAVGASHVASSVLLDPVVFLLCDPTVASVFVYKDPTSTVDLLMHFFLSRELFIANGLSRHFAWSHNILFVEDLLNGHNCCRARKHFMINRLTGEVYTEGDLSRKEQEEEGRSHHRLHKDIEHSIILSRQDSIVPIEPVSRYLQAKQVAGFSCFEVVYFDGLHGEVLLHPRWIRRIARMVRKRCRLDPRREESSDRGASKEERSLSFAEESSGRTGSRDEGEQDDTPTIDS
eukprot:gene10505-11636_t